MDLRRLPYLPIQYFYFQFSRAEKAIFIVSLLLVLVSGAFLAFSYTYPTYWALDTYELQTAEPEESVVRQVEANYRSFDLSFPLYWQKIIHAAGPIIPKAFPFFVFVILQLLAWNLMITATSLIKSRWIYLFYFIFLLSIHFSAVHELWYQGDTFLGRLVEFGIIASYLAPAFLFQVKILKWPFWARFLTFLALTLIWYGIPLSKGQILDAHGMMQTSFYFNIFLLIPFIIFSGKDLVNLIILIGNNRPQKENRWSFGLIMVVISLLVIIELLWMHEFFNWGLLGKDFQLGIRPTHMLILVSAFFVFTSQNLYHQAKVIFNSQFVYVLMLAAWAILALSFLAVSLATGDLVFVYALDRIVAIFFTAVTVFYAFFIVANHSDLLRRKVNFYYLITQANDFSFYVVWLLSLGGIVVAEGMEKWKSITLFSHTYTLNIADQARMEGDAERALKATTIASKEVVSSVKAHYNLAFFYAKNPNSQSIAIREFQQAARTFDFDYAWLNAAQLLNEQGFPDSATNVLRRAHQRIPKSRTIANNLAINYWEGYRVDSAVAVMKRALLENPNDAIMLSHLGMLYHENNRPNDAASFIEASAEENSSIPGVWTNKLVWDLLQHNKKLPTNSVYKGLVNQNFWLTYHHFLSQDLTHADTLGLQLLKTTANKAQMPEAILLDGYRLMEQDSMELGESRLSFLANTRKDYASRANFLLASSYYEKGMLGKARYFFKRQANAGDPFGRYYAALVDLDQGFIQAGNESLTILRGQEEDLFEECSKELAIILKAYGQDLYAQTEWDLSTLNLNERIRTGVYADSIGQFAFALENFRQVIEFDSSTVVPYLELGRIYNKYGDSLATLNIQFGLEKEPENKELKREMAQGFINQSQFENALNYMDTTSTFAGDLYVLGEWYHAQGMKELAKETWEKNFDINPLDEKNVLRLARFFQDNEEFGGGYELLSSALNQDDKNPFYWHYYAQFARSFGEEREAKLGAEKAVEYLPDSDLKDKIKKEFALED